ncbi:hypothetical protein [Actinacidiphila sp. bgisy160]|uniref:hypothetical protein n=1 Tax=Actinacidiphila sp. bgisy160 TaxID=3413796 RepID=UPI003D721D1D
MAVSVLLWWAGLTLVLWLLSRVSGQPAGLAGCAASAVLLVAVGEAGDWVRRRWRTHRLGRPAANPGPAGPLRTRRVRKRPQP